MTVTESAYSGTVTAHSVDCGCYVRRNFASLVKQLFQQIFSMGADQIKEYECVVSRATDSETYIFELSTD